MMEKRNVTIISVSMLCVCMFLAGSRLGLSYLPLGITENAYIETLLNIAMYVIAAGILWLFLHNLPGVASQPKSKLPSGAFLGYFCMSRGVGFVFSLLGVLISLALLLIINEPTEIINYLRDNNLPFLSGSAAMWLNLLLICIVAPLAEEFMFRRLLLDRLRPFGDKAAILYSGIAFGLLHMNMQQIFYAAALGFLFGYIMLRTNNIWYAIGLHCAVNSSSAILILLAEMMPSAWITMIILSVTAVIFLIGVAGIVLIFVLRKKNQTGACAVCVYSTCKHKAYAGKLGQHSLHCRLSWYGDIWFVSRVTD